MTTTTMKTRSILLCLVFIAGLAMASRSSSSSSSSSLPAVVTVVRGGGVVADVEGDGERREAIPGSASTTTRPARLRRRTQWIHRPPERRQGLRGRDGYDGGGGTPDFAKASTGSNAYNYSNNYNGNNDNDNDNDNDKPPTHGSGSLVMSLRSITGSVRNGNRPTAVHSMASQSYSLVGFLGLAVLGIIVYGIGLASPWVSSGLAIPVGLAGVTIFGIGEGCIMVAARAFVGRIFLGGDGAFAQGVVIAANNASMMFSKNLVPWLIETHKPEADNAASIRPGVLACLAVQAVGLLAGLLYTRLCVGDAQKPPAAAAAQTDEEEQHLLLPSKDDNDDVRQQQPSMASIKAERDRELAIINERNPIQQCTPSGIRMVVDLPLTFWVVAIGRAIFLVTFKVFSRFSNSFLIEKLNVGAVRAGRLSSVNELFALFSPLTGYLAYRSPGGIVFFAVGAALLGTFSIGSLALLPADGITSMPGGLLTPLVGISIAHGIIVPIALALVPHTVSSDQMGMAFAVVEVLGNTLNMTDILFGYLRDRAGNYDAPMKLLLAYASVGTVLLWMARKRILAIGIGRQGR